MLINEMTPDALQFWGHFILGKLFFIHKIKSKKGDLYMIKIILHTIIALR